LLLVAGVLVSPGQLRVSAADVDDQVVAPLADAGAESEMPAPASAEREQSADDLCFADVPVWPQRAGAVVPSTWWLLPRLDSVAGSVAIRPPIA